MYSRSGNVITGPHYFIAVEDNARRPIYYIDFRLEQFSTLGFFKEVEELLAWSFLHEDVSSPVARWPDILESDKDFRGYKELLRSIPPEKGRPRRI